MHTRHLHINFDRLARTKGATRSVAHLYLVVLSATQLETLEMSDMAATFASNGNSYVPYTFFAKAKPLQFDLGASHLAKPLPHLFQFQASNEGNTLTDPATWTPQALEHFVARIASMTQADGAHPQHGGGGIGFARLKHVLLMDGNSGITHDDYANLFLIPRRKCSVQVVQMQRASSQPCLIWPDECSDVSAIPCLSSLTLVLWYAELLIDATFLHAGCKLHFFECLSFLRTCTRQET